MKNNKANGYINTDLIASALQFYKKDFKLISVPMCVGFESILHTLPKGRIPLLRDNTDSPQEDTYYVGSAEQGFIEMHSQGKLWNGYYAALTPCQRNEQEDESHYTIFLKLELIIVGQHALPEMLTYVKTFLEQEDFDWVVVPSDCKDNEVDIEVNGVEVGSYGINVMPDGTPYTYGTGIAEPRLSYARGKWGK